MRFHTTGKAVRRATVVVDDDDDDDDDEGDTNDISRVNIG